MRIARLLPLLLAAACRVSADRVPPPAASAPDTSRMVAAVSAPPMPSGGRAPSTMLDPALDSLCASAARLAHDTLHIPIVRDSATSFAAPREMPVRWRGCRMTASTPNVAHDPNHPNMPDGPLQAVFLGAGWEQDLSYGADGVDGTELAMKRGDVLCHLDIRYQEVDIPDDPGAEPSKQLPPRAANPYSLEIRCTRNPARLRD
jgi:hypothetical protein